MRGPPTRPPMRVRASVGDLPTLGEVDEQHAVRATRTNEKGLALTREAFRKAEESPA
jgi:hypothetical protein